MREEFTFLSADGKTQIHAVKRVPDSGKPKAVLQLVHGMVEYIERYQPFAQYMEDNGYIVVGHDHLGHGHSVQSEDDLGYMADANHPSEVLVADMQKLRELAQKEYPDLPYVMLGHSMGSYLLRQYLSSHGEGLSAAVLSGTGDVPAGTSRMGLAIIAITKAFHGDRYRSKFVQNMAFGKPYQKYDLTGKDASNSWLTKDQAIVKKYYADPYCTYTFTLNGYKGLIESTLYDTLPENIAKIPKNLPILIASGADDPVGDCSEGVKRVYQKFQDAGLNVQMKLYENDRHEILNETDKDKVWKDLLDFYNKAVS